MSEIRRFCSDAEVLWQSYNTNICHKIQKFIKNEGIYENKNFYEFCKGSVFTAIEKDKQIEKLKADNEKLRKCVEYYAYASANNYLVTDMNKRARQTLKEIGGSDE